MAKKAATTETEKVTTVEEVKETTTVKAKETEKAPVHTRVVIAKSCTPLRKTTSLASRYVVGFMKVGVEYQITKEVNSKINGDFYLLSNGYYITKSGNYILN